MTYFLWAVVTWIAVVISLVAMVVLIAAVSWSCRKIRIWTYRHLTNRTTKSTGRI